MSWWVKEINTISEDESERLCIIETDTPNDLPNPVRTKPDPDNPGQTITDYTIVRGSEAYCLSNSKTYKLNSQGNWIEQTTGGGGGASSANQVSYDNTDSGLTATNVQDAIDEIHDTDETQDRALAELYGENANQQLEIDYAINTGAKNLFDINTTPIQNHMTSTLTDDTLTVTSNGNWAHYSVPINLPAGDYIFTMTISNFSKDSSAGATSVRIRIATSTSGGTSVVLETVTGNGPMTIPFTSPGGQLYVQFYSNYSSTTTYVSTFTASNVMIRNAVVKSATYEPYAPTNRELYETKTEQTETNVIANLGAKNMLKITASSQTIKGVTFTVNDDQTVTVNGTNDGTGASTFMIVPNAQAIKIPDGKYILSGCPAEGGGSAASAPFDLRWYLYSPGKSAYETGTGALIEKSGNTTSSNIAIVVKTGQTVDNLVFKPMLRPAEITNNTFEPYAPTNRELYEMILALQSGRTVQSLNSPLLLNREEIAPLETTEIRETEETEETNETEETE